MDVSRLGDYRIESVLGRGRAGIVYRATEEATGRTVALKVLRQELAAEEDYRERFRREAGILAALRHEHILPIYAHGEVDGHLYMATHLAATTLRGRMAGGPLAVDEAMDVIAAVAAALDVAHQHGVIHRDVKPANVLVDPGTGVFLADFGLARDPSADPLTAPGQVLGTIDYMAPELLDGDPVGAATDIYALACMALEALTGEAPFVRPTDAAVMYAHLVDVPPSACERRPELPAELDAVIVAGMAKAAAERPSTAGELAAEMRRVLTLPDPARAVAG